MSKTVKPVVGAVDEALTVAVAVPVVDVTVGAEVYPEPGFEIVATQEEL
jgi:hypothetical protein